MYFSIQRHYGDEPAQMEEVFPGLAKTFKETPAHLGVPGFCGLVEVAALSSQQGLASRANDAASCAIVHYSVFARDMLSQNLIWGACRYIEPMDRAESLQLVRYIARRGIGFDYRQARNLLRATEVEPSVASPVVRGPQIKPSQNDPVARDIGACLFYQAYVGAATILACADHDLKPVALDGLKAVEAVSRGRAPNVARARARILKA